MSDSLSNYIRKRKIANKSTWTSVVVNFFLVIFQIVVGFFSKSSGLIADGFHTLADMLSDLIVLITSKKSLNPPDDDHNYGHYRYENAVGLFLGVLLLFVGCAMIWSAGKKLENSDQIVAVHVMALYASIICLVALIQPIISSVVALLPFRDSVYAFRSNSYSLNESSLNIFFMKISKESGYLFIILFIHPIGITTTTGSELTFFAGTVETK